MEKQLPKIISDLMSIRPPSALTRRPRSPEDKKWLERYNIHIGYKNMILRLHYFSLLFLSFRNERFSSILCCSTFVQYLTNMLSGESDASCWRSVPTLEVIDFKQWLEECRNVPKVVCCPVIKVVWYVSDFQLSECISSTCKQFNVNKSHAL